VTPDQLRRYAVGRSLRMHRHIAAAVAHQGYVQADPIRAPARAQDLILRHRVKNYRIDDLENRYPSLPVFEDMFHNYGFFPEEHRELLYPRVLSPRWREFMRTHQRLRRRVLAYLEQQGEAHPRDIEDALAAGARENGWGGSSSATTLMLEGLHREGRAHIVRRDAGIRVYAPCDAPRAALSAIARAEGKIRLIVNLYAPIPRRSLNSLMSVIGRHAPSPDFHGRLQKMIDRGEFREETIDGLSYVWPADERDDAFDEDDGQLRLLAPFDPVVWDRRRFEHLWGWAYRFEAYTPSGKRKLGYYALPLLWRDQVIGWANVSLVPTGTRARDRADKLAIDIGFAQKKPPVSERAAFALARDAEIDRFRTFLRLG
jgi:uncharacterized protein YcaQ